MWHIYTSIAILLGGAYCFPLINTTDKPPCTLVIKRFGEPVTTLEVEWHSTIHLTCDVLCVGPRPQPLLKWFYRVKNQSKLISIERLFRSPKFDTYPVNFHRTKELRIRDFGPDEETKFICKGFKTKKKLEAEVELIGTDCLMKYKYRCQSDKRCIDRGQLCNYKNDCPGGEDEVGCGKQIDNTTTKDTMMMPGKDVVINQTSEESDYIDMTTTVSTLRMPETDVETKQASEESNYIDITMTVSTMRMPETDVETTQTSEETSESAPSIRIEPHYQTVEEGSPVQFECIVSARPRAKVEWHRGNRPLSPEASVTQDGVFQIPRAQFSDEGGYFCRATNNVGTSDKWTILYVTKKDTKPSIAIIVRQTSVVTLIGSTARLECYVEEETGRVTLFWSRNGGLPPGSVQTNGILTIPDIQPSYAGNYVCTGTTDTGRTGTAVTRLDVELKPFTERPTARVEPEKITVPMGTTGTLRCIVTGVPAPTITWLKSRKELSADHQIDGDILRITQATMEDQGIYVCRAENIAGSDQDWGIVEVERLMRPKIDLYPEGTQNISVGDSALFQCRVMDGDLPPKVTWSRVGGLQLTERTEVMDNGVIMFKGTTQQEQGSYICTATNDMGTTTATATLIVRGPPTIVIQPSNTINAIIGQRVRMECIAQGDPTPSVYWIGPLVPRHGDIVTEAGFLLEEGTSILDITNVGRENTGNYTCVAQNVGGRTEGRVQLIVEEGQRAEVKIAGPGTLSVVDGESVELTCTASAIPNPLIRWQRREGPLPPGHSLRGGILSIPRLTVEYGGEYICSTSSSEGSHQASVFIIVTVSPRLTVSPSRLVARAGEDIILRCSLTGSGPFNIEWSKVNGTLSPRASENEGILEIQQVTAADAGRYRCVTASSSGSLEGYAIVEITVPPTIRALKREYSVQQNAVVELRCDFTGSPEPTVRWDRVSGELPQQHRIQDGVLTIYNVQPADSGRYICTATNAAGTARDYVSLTVASGPVVNGGKTSIDNQIVNVGDRVEMECIVFGTPLPRILWSRDDGPLPASAILGDGILIIPDARLEDAGTYTCTAVNQAGSVQSKVALHIRARPLISVPKTSVTAALGDSASIGCEATGYPSPQITWFRKDGQMPSEYTIVDGNLKIPHVKTEDAGTYICSAQNQHGQSDASVALKIGEDMKTHPGGNGINVDRDTDPVSTTFSNYDYIY